jgi:hypothetical protein
MDEILECQNCEMNKGGLKQCPNGCDDEQFIVESESPEEVENLFFEILTLIANQTSHSERLNNFVTHIRNKCLEEEVEYQEYLEELFPDVICEAVYEIVNNDEWRSDKVGEDVIKNPDTLRNLYTILKEIDENTEVVFATNPYTPIDVLNELCKSTFSWEEDGTTSALARNTTNSDVLNRLANNPEDSTRFSVAANPSTPLETLEKLAEDEGFSNHKFYWAHVDGLSPVECSVKSAVMNNPSTPKQVLEKFANGDLNFSVQAFDDIEGLNSDLISQAQRILEFNQESPELF